MKAKYGGPMSVDNFYQAIFQDRTWFAEHCITHVRNAALYFTPCDNNGDPVLIYDELGNQIDGFVSAGAYASAADAYERAAGGPKAVETRTLLRESNAAAVPFSPF